MTLASVSRRTLCSWSFHVPSWRHTRSTTANRSIRLNHLMSPLVHGQVPRIGKHFKLYSHRQNLSSSCHWWTGAAWIYWLIEIKTSFLLIPSLVWVITPQMWLPSQPLHWIQLFCCCYSSPYPHLHHLIVWRRWISHWVHQRDVEGKALLQKLKKTHCEWICRAINSIWFPLSVSGAHEA